ncbi:BatD family protein [Glaciecola sp. 2405UD65-10]|uniref:BatD family protein n=1 Tax=Glaciecola sp. 2405UD65-10 TaxID=3397244 RepID=UPI003B5B4216
MKLLRLFSLLILANLISTVALPKHALAQVTELTATVDRNTVLLDESIELSITARGSADRGAINFDALKNDFNVSTPSISQSTQVINTTMTRSVTWRVNLYPKDAGVFTIPSFEVDGKRSNSFAVTILPLDAQNKNEPRDYFVEASLNNDSVYLQQQLLYTIKIYLSKDIQRGNLSLPVLEGAIIEQLGEDKDYQEITDGISYRIIERNYAIIPQSSGEFEISGPIFEAQVLTSSRQSFANFGRTRSIARRAPNVTLTVEPMPENYPYTWLPSDFVEVSEQWQGDETTLEVGEPITRTITLTAMGLTKEQLPKISSLYHPSFKAYPEQAQLSSVQHNNSIVSQGVYNTAIIPSQAGNYVLPEVRVPWFNVKTGKTEFALLPAKSVEVKPASSANNVPVQAGVNDAQNSEDTSTELVQAPSQEQASDLTAVAANNTYPNWLVYVLVSTNVFTLILALVLWLSRHNQSTEAKASEGKPVQNSALTEQTSFAQLKAELEQGKLDKLSYNLNQWLSLLLGNNHHSISLSLSKQAQSDAVNSALSHYNKVLASQYSNKDAKQDFPAFIKSLQEYRNNVLQTKPTSPLQALYKK